MSGSHNFKASGTPCNDGDACTQTDACQEGACSGANPVTCTAWDQCHSVGTCDPATGACSNPPKENGTACNDGNACTQTDTCQAGACGGANPVTCRAPDQCHIAGTCDTASGRCSHPMQADGTPCDDGDGCTSQENCWGGVCRRGAVSCARPLAEVVIAGPVPPPLDRTVATDIFDSTRFIWCTDDSCAQRQVSAEAIDRRRAAVLRGRVLDGDGMALAGVSVAVLGHEDFGHTVSRGDGGYDLVVTGGQLLTLTYDLPGLLSAQRQVAAPARDYLRVGDVRLIARDTQATAVSTQLDMFAAAGSNPSGSRRATVFFPQGTRAKVIHADGSPASEIGTEFTVRATEYTVGAGGLEAMPGQLPPTSAYTYAVELSIDEAGPNDSVEFHDATLPQPLPVQVLVYVEDFLGFEVGSSVPSGYYDRKKGVWVPMGNGRVVRILGFTGESPPRAILDTDGDGNPDLDASVTPPLTDAERRRLADRDPLDPTKPRYAVGQTLWRVPQTHFSPCDYNWPELLPDGDLTPSASLVPPARCTDACQGRGSIIDFQNQTLGEAIPLAGTPFALQYKSDRTVGRIRANTVTIKLSGAQIPPPLKRIDLEVAIAGRSWLSQFPAQASQTTEFVWDGRDAYNRLLQGRQPVTARVGYVFDSVYQAMFEANFGATSGIVTTIATRNETTVWATFSAEIGVFDSSGLGLGGWDLSAHHVYDPSRRTLYLGDGGERDVTGLGLISERVVGRTIGEYQCGFAGEGVPAMDALLWSPAGMAFGPDGSLYIADYSNDRVRVIDPTGTISTFLSASAPNDVAVAPDGTVYVAESGHNRIVKVDPQQTVTLYAGDGQGCGVPDGPGCGDGGPATEAQLSAPWRLALAPDGSLYVIEWSSFRVRRIAPDGTIHHFAGSGSLSLGDGGPATAAGFDWPTGIAVGPDGGVYISDYQHSLVRRVGLDGTITTVAGTVIEGQGVACDPATDPSWPACGDGGPGRSAKLVLPTDLVVAPDGTIFIADQALIDAHENWPVWVARIRKLGPDGTITTVAGSWSPRDGDWAPCADELCGDRGPGLKGQWGWVEKMAMDATGALYTLEHDKCRVRRLRLPLTGVSSTNILIPSRDGSELYEFNSAGRHEHTKDALTGDVRLTFGYGDGNRLTSISDDYGNTTTITRTAGAATILGPYGQRTDLVVDDYLQSVTNPANEMVQLGYHPSGNGLLTSLTSARNKQYTFEYEADGRLKVDRDPAGGSQTLAREETTSGWTVTNTTPQNVTSSITTSWKFETDGAGVEHHETTFTGATNTTTMDKAPDGTRAISYTVGTTEHVEESPDPRWGMDAPLTASTTTEPGIPASVTTESVVVDPPATTELFSYATLTRSVTRNGKTAPATYDRANRRWDYVSPEGRTATALLDPHGRVVQQAVPGLASVFLGYDSTTGQLTSITAGSGGDARPYTLDYNGTAWVYSITDPLNQTTTFQRDAVGRVRVQTRPDLNAVLLDFDANGNLTSLTPPGKTAHTFTYTDLDLGASYIPPSVGFNATSYDYNLARQLRHVTRPDGSVVTLNYSTDGSGQLAEVVLPRGSVGFTYYPDTAQLYQVTAPGPETVTYTYEGGLLNGTSWSGAVTGSVERTYNRDFQLDSLSITGGGDVSFAYDNDGLLTRAGALDIARNATNGLVTGTTLGEVTTTVVARDTFGAVTDYVAQYSGTDVFRMQMTVGTDWDHLGRLKHKVETVLGNATEWWFSYDGANRLNSTSWNGTMWNGTPWSGATTYTYDANGNRAGCTYDEQDRMTVCGATSYTYTAAGDLSTKLQGGQTTTYSYDPDGALKAVSIQGGLDITYVLDGYGRRVGKKVGGTLEQGFLYGDGLRIIAELDGMNGLVSQFVYGSHANVPSYMVREFRTYRLITDRLGSVRLVVDAGNETVAQRLEYDVWGKVLYDSNPGFQPFGFAGGLYDPDTGLVRFGARDYDPERGRWTVKDPIGFAGGDANLYGYVVGDPVNRLDPSGLVPGDRFQTELSAAIDALEFINPVSINQSREYGGLICEDNNTGEFFATGPVRGNRNSCRPYRARCPRRSRAVAYYHTHGADDPNFWNERFSPTDRTTAGRMHNNAYLATPSYVYQFYDWATRQTEVLGQWAPGLF